MGELVTRANARQQALWNGSQGWFWAREQQRYDRMLFALEARLLHSVGIRSGEQIIDIGCGSGSTTLALARMAGPFGQVLGMDISALLLALARQRVTEAALAQVELICADAAAHDLAPESIDVIVSRFGMSYFGDLPAAYRHIVTWLRPTGRLGHLCWQAEQANEWMSLPRVAMSSQLEGWPACLTERDYIIVSRARRDEGARWFPATEAQRGDATHVRKLAPEGNLAAPPGPVPRQQAPAGQKVLAPGPCALADPQDIRELLAGAGLGDIRIEPITGVFPVGRDAADVVAFFRAGGLDELLARLPPAIAAARLNTLQALLAARETSQGVLLGFAAWLVTARAGIG